MLFRSGQGLSWAQFGPCSDRFPIRFQVSPHKRTRSLSLSLLQWRRPSLPSSATVDAASVSGFSPQSPRLPFPASSATARDGHSERPFLSLSLSPEASPKTISPPFQRAQVSATSSLKLLSPPPKPSPSQ